MSADADALALLGRLADGAMRDGESLLERMLAAGQAVTRAAVEDALGLPPGERVRGVAQALVLDDAGAALAGAAELYRAGFAGRTVVEGLVSALGDALHAELGLGTGERLEGGDTSRLLRLQAALDEQASRFARSADQLSLELALTHALLAAETPGSPARPAPAAPASASSNLAQRLTRLERDLAALRASGGATPAAAPTPAAGSGSAAPGPLANPVASSQPVQATPPASPGPAALSGTWADVLQAASLQLRAFLKPARMHAEPGYVSLSYDERGCFHAKQVLAKLDEVKQLVQRTFGPVIFELITPDGTQRSDLGQDAGVTLPQASPAAPPPAPAAPSTPAPEAAGAAPAPFAPRKRRGPDFAPLDSPVAANPSPSAEPPPGLTSPVSPASPDDRAAAPLPAETPPPWAAAHVVDAPPPETEPQQPSSRELYLAEPVTEEPAWDEVGGDFLGSLRRWRHHPLQRHPLLRLPPAL
ncbi:hypothetical protein ACFP81_04740 [Deinococcus lacus]|uniref:DNA polymerase III gamma subunit domain-containing protein n=1 Tax=Deinococcus lacus TaxID=392561 RepID=A0ABW1YD50_9DEIO